jgi:hypothetical protein
VSPFFRIARVAVVAAVICVTVGASGVLATMTWQAPPDAKAVTAGTMPRATSSSLIMTAANAYIDGHAARMALQTATPKATEPTASPKAKAGRDQAATSLAQFQQTCLKRVSKRRNAKLVHVPCSPLQGGPPAIAVADDTSAAQIR